VDTGGRVNEPARRRPGGRQVIPRPEAWRLGGGPPWGDVDRPPTLDAVLRRVRGRAPGRIAPPFPDARSSAVLVLLQQGPEGPEALFTRRAQHLRHHRGEVSFPGGRMEPGETPEQAALREACEEVNLDPAVVTLHGELDHLSTVVSRSYIIPVVATVDDPVELHPAPGEVERILWVSLAELSREDTYREEWWGTPPLDRPVFFFELDDETIWGATGRMLHQLLRLAHDVEGDEPLSW